MENNTKVLTGKVRLSYVHVFKPKPSDDGGEPKYSVVLLISKKDTATLTKIRAAIEAAKQKVVDKFGGKIPVNLKNPLRDGDTDPPGGNPRPELAGMMFMTVSSYDKPVVVDENRQDVIDQSQVYSWCYARASVNFAAYNHKSGGKGIGAYLNGIQKLADGESLGFAREDADTMFGDDGADALG